MKRFRNWLGTASSMLTMMVVVMLMLLVCMMQTGCASARVTNEASYKVTSPDGTVVERRACNRIFALGDKAVEQNLKGSLADATEADLSAGIQESAQKSESGVIAEGMFALGGKAMDTLGKYFDARIPGGGADATKTASAAPAAPSATPAVTGAATSTGETATDAACEGESCNPPAAASAEDATMTGTPGANSVGVYGRPSCSLCQLYKKTHPDVPIINIDKAEYNEALWTALRARKYEGTRAGLPIVITDTGYVTSAK